MWFVFISQVLACLVVVHAQILRGNQGSLHDDFTSGGGDPGQVEELRKELQPLWTSLPKTQAGYLEHQTARYILHRLFVQRHGWYIKGLETLSWNNVSRSTSGAELKDWVPPLLLPRMEGKVARQGVDLHDLVVLAAALEHSIRQEVAKTLKEIYASMGLPATESVSKTVAQDIILAYVARFLAGTLWPTTTKERVQRFVAKYRDWNRTLTWYKQLENKQLATLQDNSPVDFAMVTAIAADIGANYGNFNEQQCQEMKEKLSSTWSKGRVTGRLRLVDFYKAGLRNDSQWVFGESADYLNSLGALDNSNETNPMVIIPNYLTSRPNCLEATHHYAMCCRNECESWMQEVEVTIAAPVAAPERIIEILSLRSPEQAPNLRSPALLARLREISDTHGGSVHLHGRLFAQWMHHVYPSECPFPHAQIPSTPDQWLGESAQVSEEERRSMVDGTCGAEQAAAEWQGELPWSSSEVLLSGSAVERVQHAKRGFSWPWLVGCWLAAAGLAAVALSKPKWHPRFSQYCWLGAFVLVCLSCNLLNLPLLVVVVVAAVVADQKMLGVRSAKKDDDELPKFAL